MMKTGLIATLIATILMVGMTLWAINGLPESGEVPVHWNSKGEVDRYASVDEAKLTLWIMPAIGFFMGLILAIVPLIDPRKINLERSKRAYLAIWIATLGLMTITTGIVSFAISRGNTLDPNVMSEIIPSIVTGTTAILFIVIGNYLPKTRSNWFLGVRTPWTLSSDETWEKTHRISGRLFLIFGIICLASVFLIPAMLQIGLLTAGSLLICAFSVIYSYLAWKNASDRTPAPDYIE